MGAGARERLQTWERDWTPLEDPAIIEMLRSGAENPRSTEEVGEESPVLDIGTKKTGEGK